MESQGLSTARRVLRSWPRFVSGALALIPVAAFAFIVGNLVTESYFIVAEKGLGHLLSTEYSSVYDTGRYIFGMLPALWGTVLSVLVAMAIAAPLALALALLSSEFPLGFISRSVRWVLGVLSGIPPIIYALMAIVVAQVFVQPKFCAWGIPETELPPEGMTWYEGGILPHDQSTLVAGMLLAFLVLPFMAPMMDDAIRGASRELKEASLALGATRWHTMSNVVLPAALSGLTGALALGALKVIGDVIVIAFAVGYASGLPSPLLDIFEPTASLTSVGAGLLAAFSPRASVGFSRSAGYFTGLLVFVLAIVILLLAGYLQRRLKARYSA